MNLRLQDRDGVDLLSVWSYSRSVAICYRIAGHPDAFAQRQVRKLR